MLLMCGSVTSSCSSQQRQTPRIHIYSMESKGEFCPYTEICVAADISGSDSQVPCYGMGRTRVSFAITDREIL